MWMQFTKNLKIGCFFHTDVTTNLETWKLKSTYVQLQNSFFKLKCLSFRRTSSKYNMKQQTRGQLYAKQTSKIGVKIFTHF